MPERIEIAWQVPHDHLIATDRLDLASTLGSRPQFEARGASVAGRRASLPSSAL
jgi:hypothetical protein